MVNKISTLLLLIITCSFLSISCEHNSTHIEFLDLNEEGLATFELSNSSDSDISDIELELTYLNADNEVIKVDTVNYNMSGDSNAQVFLRAGEQTIITQRAPDDTSTATGKIISRKPQG